ncbi:uncharacterized protein LOC118502701 [Anopheles stephensi]|uniref:uncharacterized protein LOC118502701 n=1 Tax=Anopheles stephensi TaxID=30069 RepID=UPI001658A6B0|nr:uncharacterized protein LOC118502701 [Anopheles stephensi]
MCRMDGTFFKVIIRDDKWDVRTEAKRFGMLYQLFIDHKKPKEVFIKYKSARDAEKAKRSLAMNENVSRVEEMEKWDIKPKKVPEKKLPDMNGSGSGLSDRNAQHRAPANSSAAGIGGGLIEPIPLMLGMFNACTSCRKGGASFQCFVCGAFYCGEPCQRADWPGHIVQCLPRLVRIHNGYVPNEAHSMPFAPPSMMQTHGTNNNHTKQNVLNKQPEWQQNRPAKEVEKSPSKPTTEPKQNRDRALDNVTPVCSVPTNVLKNLALKRHQEASTSKQNIAAATAKPETSTSKIEAITVTKENVSKLTKRAQQKATGPAKRTIQYSTFPPAGECVKISYVADNVLFVYRSGQEANGQPNRYLDLIKRSVECARGVQQFLADAPKPCDVVFAPFDGDHYRAVVKAVDGPMASVFYPDFGNTQTVEWNQMKEIPDREIQYSTCYTHPVMIEGVADFSPLVKQHLEELLEMEDFELVKVDNEKPITTVEMRHVQELYLLSETLKELAKKETEKESGAAAPSAKATDNEKQPSLDPPTSYVPVTGEDFTEHDLPLGEDVQLLVVEASDLNVSNQLSVVLKSDSLEFAKMMNECDQCGNKDPHPYQPTGENEVFLVHFDGCWCRALLAGVGEEALYYLLDLGIIRALEEKPNCRRYPAGLTRKIFVSECIVDNLEALGELAKEENNDSLRGKTLIAKVYQNTDDDGETMHVTIHSIN